MATDLFTHVGHAGLHWSRNRNPHRDTAPRPNVDHALNVLPYRGYQTLCGRFIPFCRDDDEYGESTGPRIERTTEGVSCARCRRVIAKAEGTHDAH